MGYDLYMKNCPRSIDDDCSTLQCNHYIESESSFSGNFNKFGSYWSIYSAHGHSGRVVAIQIRRAIRKLVSEGHLPYIPDGCDGWSSTINVFHLHMARLLKFVDEYPDETFVSDQLYNVISDSDDTDNDSESDDDEPKIHPKKLDSDNNTDSESDDDEPKIHAIGSSASYILSIDGNPRFGKLYISDQDDPESVIIQALTRPIPTISTQPPGGSKLLPDDE